VQVILAAYMIANVRAADSEQGLLTVALTIIGFIVKKTLLGMTDRIHIETAMLIAGAAPTSTLLRAHAAINRRGGSTSTYEQP
jgi:hypothetical protein